MAGLAATRDRLSNPVFFIGMGRSGSTVIYEAFSAHEELGWLSNYSRVAPCCPLLNAIVRTVDNRWWFIRGAKRQGQPPGRFNRVLPRPDEAYPVWERYAGEKFRHSFLQGVKPSPGEAEGLHSVFGLTLASQGKNRFVAKITGPPRIGYLSAVFPDATFIHIVRDGRAVVHSLLNVAFWRKKGGLNEPAWEHGLEDPDIRIWEDSGRDPVVLASLQWCKVIEVARREKALLGSGQYLEIRYEDFVDDPRSVLTGLFDYCGLTRSGRAYSYVKARGPSRNMNEKYKELDAGEIRKMEEIMCRYLEEFGYRQPRQRVRASRPETGVSRN